MDMLNDLAIALAVGLAVVCMLIELANNPPIDDDNNME